MIRWPAYYNLLLARMRELGREPEVVFWVFFFPVLLAVALGTAFRDRPPDKIFVAVVQSPEAPRVASALDAAPPLKAEIIAESEAAKQFRLGKMALVVYPRQTPSEASRSAGSGSAPEGTVTPARGPETRSLMVAPEAVPSGAPAYTYRYDPGRPDSLLARSLVDAALQSAAGRHDPLVTRNQPVTEPGARYIDFLIPGLLGMNLMSGGLWGVGFAVVDMRVKKLLKRLIATPMQRSDFLMALISSRLMLMLVETVLLLLVGKIVFSMVIQGNLVSIIAVGAVGALCFAGIGLLVASRARKIETVSGLMNLVMLPMFVLSGVFFSAERFPAAVQPFIRMLPLTALNDALRAVMLEGASFGMQGARLAVMALWGAVCFLLALRWFRWI